MKRLLAACALLVSTLAFSADYSVIRRYSYPVAITLAPTGSPLSDARMVGNGSAITIAPGYMISAAHVFSNKPTGAKFVALLGPQKMSTVEVIKTDPRFDLALLKVPGVDCPCVTLAQSVEIDEQSWAVGFPRFMTVTTQFVTSGTIQGMWRGSNDIVSTSNTGPGGSGGGLFVRRGTEFHLAGITRAIDSNRQGPEQLDIISGS